MIKYHAAIAIEGHSERRRLVLRAWKAPLVAAALVMWSSGLSAQATGTIFGRVVDAASGQPLAGALVRTVPPLARALTTEDGRFVLVGVPAGERTVRVEMLGYRPLEITGVQVRAGRGTELRLELESSALELEPVRVAVERVRLIEPEVALTHEVVIGRELRELPLDRVAEAIELAPGVSDGHFRGGRVGQESYVLDGVEVRNQFEGSVFGLGLEISPTALDEVEVITGGFGAEYGSALSGVVSFVTRRGDPDRWTGRASLTTDHWAPESLFRGFTGLSASAGGPLRPLGATLFADVLLQGFMDADPRARGLTCLRPGDTGPELAQEIEALRSDPTTSHLYCPYTGSALPAQRGDKLIGFARLDRPFGDDANLTLSLLRNRSQRQLYTPEFKYNAHYQLGQRTTGTLASIGLDRVWHLGQRAFHVTARGAFVRVDRYLGALDLAALRERATFAGFGFSDFEFLGEDFVRSPVEDQIAAGIAVPGYVAPGGSVGSPFGPAAEGIFFTTGTPEIAAWSRFDSYSADLVGEMNTTSGHAVRAGASAKLFEVQSYERVLSYLPGSLPNYARFYPRTLSAFAEAQLAAADQVTIYLGGRIEAFQAGLRFRRDRSDFLGAVEDTEWKVHLAPRLGVALPVPGTDGRTSFRFTYGRVSQPPDFRYFLDTAIDDSLRTDIRRQGNPNLAFERGTSYEAGLTQLVGDNAAISAVAFRKELSNLVTGSITFSDTDPGQFTTGDFGTVNGLELSLRGRWPLLSVRVGYTLQKATGVASTAFSDSIIGPDEARVEFPLAFDRRHSADFAIMAGAAGGLDARWSAVLTGSLRSGYPLDRRLTGPDAPPGGVLPERLPWTGVLDARVAYDIGAPPGCNACTVRLLADARNLLGRENIIGLRRTTGLVAPSREEVEAMASAPPQEPIPFESPRYSARIDFDGNGVITDNEYRRARFAAALDRFDPSLFFGEARQIRLGVEVLF